MCAAHLFERTVVRESCLLLVAASEFKKNASRMTAPWHGGGIKKEKGYCATSHGNECFIQVGCIDTRVPGQYWIIHHYPFERMLCAVGLNTIKKGNKDCGTIRDRVLLRSKNYCLKSHIFSYKTAHISLFVISMRYANKMSSYLPHIPQPSIN